MKKIIAVIVIFFLLQTISNASNKNNILQRLEQINNISFSFIQTINGKDVTIETRFFDIVMKI